jgi:hypothetical protein
MHRFIAIDEGLNTLQLVDEREPELGWRVDMERDVPAAR